MLHASVAGIEIGERSVRFSVGAQIQEQACGQVIIALGAQPDDKLFKQLSASRAKVHQIGDCRRIGYIEGALLDARELVHRLEKAP